MFNDSRGVYKENQISLYLGCGRFHPARSKFKASHPIVSPLHRLKLTEIRFPKSVGGDFKDFFLRFTGKCSGDLLKLARKRLEHFFLLPPPASSGVVKLRLTPELTPLSCFHPFQGEVNITVTTFKYVEGGPDREAPEVV